MENESSARPFIKWAGGKKQLLGEIRKYYPFNEKINKYCEAFVGAGAVLFDVLNNYELKEIYISDVNSELINLYKVIKNDVDKLIEILSNYQDEYSELSLEERKPIYYSKRDEFNKLKVNQNSNHIKRASLFIFLNKTGFNGLYRENKSGGFNVPIGSYVNPKILDKSNLLNVSDALKNVEIVCGDYKESEEFIDSKTFVYFDPPYRPINATSKFTAYSKSDFNDKHQIELAEYFKIMDKRGAKLLLSNSDPKNHDPEDEFFDDLYKDFTINRVRANRMINSNKSKRGQITEVLINNYG